MIRIGIIGCGKIAQVRHLPEYAANPHVELAGYYDLNTQRAQEMAAQYGGKVYDSYFDLLNDPSIDAVSICVENRSHAEITTYALYAGKHVLCEKPMAVTLAECESMVAAAERNGKHLMIGHNMRFDPVHRKAKELLDGGIIGDIITFRATMGNAGPENWSLEAGSTWFFDKQKAAMGALSDLGIHKVDLLQYLTGQKVIETTAKVMTLNKHTATGAPITVVTGIAGGRSPQRIQGMGEMCGKYADRIFFTTDNPDFDDPADIAGRLAHAAAQGGPARVTIQLDRTRAVEQAILEAPEGAVIVLAGKGNDAIQRVRGGYVHYDSDPVVARRALALREKQRT